MKKWMSLFLAVVMLFSSIPLNALAAAVTADAVVSLSVETLPDKMEYLPGETPDLTGLTIRAEYSSGSSKILFPEELTVDVPEVLESGDQTVTVSCEGQSVSFVLHVHTVQTLETVEPTFMETGLTEGTVCGDPGCGRVLQAQEVLPVKAAPTLETPEISVRVSADGVEVSWNAVEYAQSYQVYRKSGDGAWTLLDTVTGVRCLDDGAAYGVSVSYTVRACLETAGGMVYSGDAAEKSLFFVDAKLLNIAGGVSVQWNEVEDASYYHVYRRVDGSWETICAQTTERSFLDETAQSGDSCEYAVRAYVNGKFTNYHYDLEILRLSQPEAAVSNRADGVRITWNEVEEAESYNVYRRIGSGSWKLLSNEVDTSYLDTTAESGTSYTYTVRAKNGSTLSSNKQKVTILCLAQPELTLYNIADGVCIKWTDVEGAESYRVYRKVPGGSWTLLKKGLTSLSYTDTTAQAGVTYGYSVRAYRDGTYSCHHTSETCIRLEQPKLEASNVYNGIELSWNETAAAESYNVYRKTGDSSWKLLANVQETAYLDKTAEDNGSYSYMVRAKSGSALSSNRQKAAIARLAETDVTVVNSTAGITVKWTAVASAESYRVYRKLPGEKWTRIISGLTDLNYVDTTAESGVTYLYAVRAWNTTGGSDYASSAQILRLSQPEVVAENKGSGVKITWNQVAGAESYVVYRKTGSGSWEKLSTQTDTTYLDTTAESGTAYSYQVRAKSGTILSGNKQKAAILRLSRPEATVSNVYTGVSVKWEAVVGAESYRVYRKVPDGSWKTLADGVTTLQYTDTTARSGVSYYYLVRAYGGDDYSSAISTEVIQHLARPVASAKTLSTTSVKVTWGAVEGASEYILYVKTGDADWKTLYTGTAVSYTARELTFGETYSYRVRAVSDSARSARSATVTGKATYLAPTYSVELEPGEGIRISWKAVEGAGSYRVYRRTEDGSWKTLKTTASKSFVDTTGKPGVTYEYAVRAFELAGAEGVSGIRAAGKTIVYSKIDPDKPMVALTFDDGPSKYTADILDQLEKYDAHATFFVVGNRVSSFSKTIKRAYEMGCEIGNHSWDHPALSAISVSAMKSQISRTDAAVKKVIGVAPTLLRPPYGAVDSAVKKYAGKPLIHWSIDTRDWEHRNSSRTISSVMNNVRDGSIILMHDIYAATRTAAVSLIPKLIKKGYQLVTVSELAAYRDVDLKKGKIYYSIYP